MSQQRTYHIARYTNSNLTLCDDQLAAEEPLQIWLKYYDQQQHVVTECLMTTMRTPGDDINLAKGWLHTSTSILSRHIIEISTTGVQRVKGLASNRLLIRLHPDADFDPTPLDRIQISHSSCGVCGQKRIESLTEHLAPLCAELTIDLTASQIFGFDALVSKLQPLFSATGGSHSAALVDETGGVIDIREDVGRHNALDKLIGANLGRLPGKFALVLSGRVSFEMVQKSAAAGISMIVAFGAPTSLAVDLCIEWDITLVGFVSAKGFNIYHGQEHIHGE